MASNGMLDEDDAKLAMVWNIAEFLPDNIEDFFTVIVADYLNTMYEHRQSVRTQELVVVVVVVVVVCVCVCVFVCLFFYFMNFNLQARSEVGQKSPGSSLLAIKRRKLGKGAEEGSDEHAFIQWLIHQVRFFVGGGE